MFFMLVPFRAELELINLLVLVLYNSTCQSFIHSPAKR